MTIWANRRNRLNVGLILAAILTVGLLAACGESEPEAPVIAPTAAPAPSISPEPVAQATPDVAGTEPEEPVEPDEAVIVTFEHPDLGTILTDGAGHTLYLFTLDKQNESTCNSLCAETWVPLSSLGEPSSEQGARVRAITRDDGSLQVAYNGWPLYRLVADKETGDAFGQNVGDAWFVVSPAGGPIQNNALVMTSKTATLGTHLIEGSGRTVYLFTMDERGKSNCNSGCSTAWPPLLTLGDPADDEGAVGRLLDSTTRDDGSTQVTYNGWPLYYFAADTRPGDANGQNVADNWFVVSTAGGPIQDNAAVKTFDHPDLGAILTDTSGRTIYLFADDEKSKSNCTEGCATAWPPLLTLGDPTGNEWILPDLLRTTNRPDGSTQVTYNGWPLYYFGPEQKPGDTNGQNVADVWFVVSPAGVAITPTNVEAPVAVASTPTSVRVKPDNVQEIAVIQNYRASEFFPSTVIAVKDQPLFLYMTRLHKEHVNMFTIEPFLRDTEFFPPGTMQFLELNLDQAGEFQMRNVGHLFQGAFIVVETPEDAKALVAEMGVQEFSIIHDLGNL